MQQLRETPQRRSVHAVVIVSSPEDGSATSRTVVASLRRGNEKLWSTVETVASGDTLEAAMLGTWRVLGEAIARRLPRLDVFVSEPELVPILERREEAPEDLGQWYIRVRSRCNQLSRVRFIGVGHRPPEQRNRRRVAEEEPTLFGSAVA